MSARAVSLEGLDLQAGNFRVTNTDAFSSPKKEITLIELARDDGARNVFERFTQRDIGVEGYINSSTSDDADASVDLLKTYLNRKDLELKIGFAGGSRIWTVAFQELAIGKNTNDPTYYSWTGKFLAPKPFAIDETSSSTLASESALTAATSIIAVDGEGTYLVVPEIVITINSIDPDDSDVSITVSNPATSRSMTITQTLQAGDVITLDCFNKVIYLNSAVIPGVGNFPTWLPSAGTLEVSDTATTRNIDVSATYRKRYL